MMRIEKDSLGEMEVPSDVYYGIHTCRSLGNFDGAGEPLPMELVYGMATLKIACARANEKMGMMPSDKANAIVESCNKILAGGYDDQFPIDVFQAGSGTSSHMNLNEVIANLACTELGGQPGDRSLVHPNDDVNKGQSTNNIFPSAIRIASVEGCQALSKALDGLIGAMKEKAAEFSSILKSARTHLQDAVPISLGQEFSAWAHALEKSGKRMDAAVEMMLEVGVGGNAVGTGINTKPGYKGRIIEELNALTHRAYRAADNGIEITQFLTDMGGLSSALRGLATDLLKTANDLRLLASGPNAGLREIRLPAVEPGSSIMPGKINPSICEAANMACMQVVGNDAAIAMACAAGQLELNTHMPLVGTNLIKSIGILTRTCTMLARKCICGIEARENVCKRNFEVSAGLPTILNPELGYDRVSELVKESIESGMTLRELVLKKHLLSAEEFEALLAKSTEPNL